MTQPLKIFLIMMMVIMAGITINTCATAQSTTTLSKFAKFADALTPDDLFIGVHAKSNHDKAGFNEDHDWKSVRLSWEAGERFNTGVFIADFKNSLYKHTRAYGGFLEYDIVEDVLFIEDLGSGAQAFVQDGQHKGYDASVVATPYVYIEGRDFEGSGFVGDIIKHVRVSYMYMPEIDGVTPQFDSYLIELKHEF